MKKIAELVRLIQNGAKPVVQFGRDIADKESYPDAGMRARALSVRKENSDVLYIEFDFSEFEAFNLPFEQPNYYDKAGKPTLTARQAGFYRPQDNLYFDADEDVETSLELVADERTALYNQYQASGTSETYVSWLESKALEGTKT